MRPCFGLHKCGRTILFIVCCTLSASIALSQNDDITGRARRHYNPDSWPRSIRPPILGLKLDDFILGEEYELKEKRLFPATDGTSYIWLNKREDFELWTIINVYESAGDAREKLFEWLAMGTNALLRKGTLTSSTTTVGDISWADSESFTLVFIRDNAMILILGRTDSAPHRRLIDDIAKAVDDAIVAQVRTDSAAENIKKLLPVIDTVTVEKSSLRVNEMTKLTVIAHDPRGKDLRYGYRATGGNILRTAEGVFYVAAVPGTHTITVRAVNQWNMSSERKVSVTVVKE